VDAKFVRCYAGLFIGGGSYKNPLSVGFVSGARLCHERKMSATMNNFSLWKESGPRKCKMFCLTFYFYHLNLAWTGTLSVLWGPSPVLALGQAQAHADLKYTWCVVFLILFWNFSQCSGCVHTGKGPLQDYIIMFFILWILARMSSFWILWIVVTLRVHCVFWDIGQIFTISKFPWT
jgi:hypothetical protein